MVSVKLTKILTFGSMEISANLVCVCLLDLILLSTLITKSVGSQDVVRAERDTEGAASDIVYIQQLIPLMERGSAQVSVRLV